MIIGGLSWWQSWIWFVLLDLHLMRSLQTESHLKASGWVTLSQAALSAQRDGSEQPITSGFPSSVDRLSEYGDRFGQFSIVQLWHVFGTVCKLGMEVSSVYED